jgi:FkbM family methyltransferase
LWYLLRPSRGDAESRLPWDDNLKVRADETNGKTILERGLDQLIVVEACIRLAPSGGVGVDIGANYGQMTVALAHGMQAEETVYSFEPHPFMFEYLQENAEPYATVLPIQKAVSEKSGTSTLHVPRTWRSDAGVSSLEPDFRDNTEEVQVETVCLDEVFSGNREIDVLKVDVEGHEYSVFAGGRSLLSEGRIKNIIFEEHDYRQSDVVPLLRKNGYSLFTVEKTLTGPELTDAHPDEKNFVATIDEQRCRQRFKKTGWRALGQA